MSFPPKTKGLGEELPRCPWCGGWMDDAKVSAQELLYALHRIDRQAYLMGVPVECPECGKPSELDVVNHGQEQTSWLTGARTATDKKYLGEPA